MTSTSNPIYLNGNAYYCLTNYLSSSNSTTTFFTNWTNWTNTTVDTYPSRTRGGYPPSPEFDDNGFIHYIPQEGKPFRLKLPDDAILIIKEDGNYELNTKDAKVKYKGQPIRDFNVYVNASDRLEEFIKFCAQFGLRKDEFMELPIRHFIAWLIVEAAKADKVPEPDIPLISDLRQRTRPRCISCGRFLKRTMAQRHIVHCRTSCYEKAIL